MFAKLVLNVVVESSFNVLGAATEKACLSS